MGAAVFKHLTGGGRRTERYERRIPGGKATGPGRAVWRLRLQKSASLLEYRGRALGGLHMRKNGARLSRAALGRRHSGSNSLVVGSSSEHMGRTRSRLRSLLALCVHPPKFCMKPLKPRRGLWRPTFRKDSRFFWRRTLPCRRCRTRRHSRLGGEVQAFRRASL
jgi:hypothetical protein